jgi:hypothetical protein
MSRGARGASPETALQMALATSLVLLAGGAAFLIYGGLAGGAGRSRREQEGAPGAGSVPGERHQHIATVSAR